VAAWSRGLSSAWPLGTTVSICRSTSNQTRLTGHAVAFRSREGSRVHVYNAAWSEVVVRFLSGEVEEPGIVVAEEGESVELGGGSGQVGIERWIAGLVDGEGVLGEDSEQEAAGEGELAVHLAVVLLKSRV